MSNYLRSEIYRVFHTKETYFLIAGLAASSVFIEVLMAVFVTKSLGTKDAFYGIFDGMKLLCFLCIIIASVVFAVESKNHSLKYAVAYGTARGEIFLGRLITELIVASICFVASLAAYIVGAYLMLSDSGSAYTIQLIKGTFAATPIFIVCMVFTHSLYYFIDNELTLSIVWTIVIAVIPKILSALGSKVDMAGVIADYMPWYALSNITVDKKTGDYILGWLTNEGIIKCLLVGIIGSVVCYIIGLMVFRRKEIK